MGHNVTSIGPGVFSGCASLESIQIPEQVTSIQQGTFSGCSSLQSITIPKGITSIGRFAFQSCSSLLSVYITDIAAWCGISFFDNLDSSNPLYGANLYLNGALVTDLVVPDHVEAIADFAFCGCASLQSVTITKGTIGEKSFYACPNLQQVTIDQGVTQIGYTAFTSNKALTKVFCKSTTPPLISLSGNTSWGAFNSTHSDMVIYVPMEAVDTYKTRNGWKDYKSRIQGYDYNQDQHPANHEIWYQTSDGQILNIVRFEGFGPTIKTHTYENGKGILSFDGDVTAIGEAFSNQSRLIDIQLPQSVVSIADAAFTETSLTEITLPENVEEIGIIPFTGCSSLSKFNGKFASTDGRCLVVNGTLKAFAPAGITAYTIPNCATIGEGAFYDCSSIITLSIPESVTSIENSAFYGCTQLQHVYCEALTPPTAVLYDGVWDAFEDNASGRQIYVPSQSVDLYKAADGWKEYADYIEGYDF